MSARLRFAAAALLAVSCGGPRDRLAVAGTVEVREVRLAPLAGGRLVRLVKDEGDSVHRGDTVAILEQPGLGALIAQRRAQARAAAARVAEVQAALADSARAANDLARAVPLAAQGVVSPQQFDNLKSAAAAAAARLQAVRAASADSLAADAAVAAAEAIGTELVVLAPADGVILTRVAEPGEAVAAGAPIATLGVVHDVWIRAYVGERLVARVTLGQSVQVLVDGLAQPVPGTISEIASRAEFTPRAALTERERADLVFAIKVRVGDAGGRLKAGMPVTVDIPLRP
ncbi:MAG TPA: efflux RND transporter periplasmic adaptor subunit [Gemmatimonadales bacterium]|nr:efflux RND transporter periplasmic adaptor subunit [Gemmatimonadales bacterium]